MKHYRVVTWKEEEEEEELNRLSREGWRVLNVSRKGGKVTYVLERDIHETKEMNHGA